MSFLEKLKNNDTFINYINESIDRNFEIRSALRWEETWLAVSYSLDGKKNMSFIWGSYQNNRKGFEVNFLKRQYKATMNLLLNNELKAVITRWISDLEEDELIIIRKSLDYVLEHKSNFYDNVMNNILHHWLTKWLCPVFVRTEKNKLKIEFYDPIDVFLDLRTTILENQEIIIRTYVKDLKEIQNEFPEDFYWKKIDYIWDNGDYESDLKNCQIENQLSEDQQKEKIIIREIYFEEDDRYYKVIATKFHVLSKTKINTYSWWFPFLFFKCLNNPDRLYPQSWYRDFILIEAEVNDIIRKINHVIKISWRHVYVIKGTKIEKVLNDSLNSLWIDVFAVEWAPDIPKWETLLEVSPQALWHLEFLIEQMNLDWGMQHDVLWKSTLWANASWIAIQSLQAGSKNNIGLILIEMNKFISKLAQHIIKLIWAWELEIPWLDKDDINLFKNINIKISTLPRTAFDEVWKVDEVIKMIDLIKANDPNTPVPYKFIIELFWFKNDIAERLLREIEQSENPDILIARAENMKLQNGFPVDPSESDDHELHMMLHSELLQNVWPESKEWQFIIEHLKLHEWMLQVLSAPDEWK